MTLQPATILYIGDSISLRMAFFFEEARKSFTHDNPQCRAVKHNGKETEMLNNADDQMNTKLVEYLKDFRFSSFSKCFYFMGAPPSKFSKFCDQFITPATRLELTPKYEAFITTNHISTVILSFSEDLTDISIRSPDRRTSFDFFMHQCAVLRGLGIRRIYIQDLIKVPLRLSKTVKAQAFNFSDPHGLHLICLKALKDNFDNCERHLLGWDGVIAAGGPCMTSYSGFLDMAKKQNFDEMNVGKSATTNAGVGGGGAGGGAAKSPEGAVMLAALRSIKGMIVSMELSHLTCPHIDPVRKQCTNRGYGFNLLLTDGMHPAGEAGAFIARAALTDLVEDMYAREVIGTKAEKSKTIADYVVSPAYPNKDFSTLKVLKNCESSSNHCTDGADGDSWKFSLDCSGTGLNVQARMR
jgi:hypothetical protein